MDKTALLKKVRALAEHGVGGEAENAEKLLARMMKKYGISEEELDEETRVRRDFTYHGGEEKKILRQVVYKVTGGYAYELVYTASGRKVRTQLGADCTPAEKVEIEYLFDFYKRLWEKEKDAFLAAYIQKHRTGKWCPRPWMGDDMNAYYGTSGNEQWARFKARLSGNEEVFDMDINEARKQLTSCADTGDTPSAWAKEAAEYCKRKGIFNGDGAGNFGWQQPITREAVACIIYRALEAAGALGNLSDV